MNVAFAISGDFRYSLKSGTKADIPESSVWADFVAKLFAALPTRNYRIREAGISNPILRTLARP